jgi:hypothetical protein
MFVDFVTQREPLPRWRKIAVVVYFVLLVVPFFYAIFYPALTGTSPNEALFHVISYLNSPLIIGLFIVLIVFMWITLLSKYSKWSRGTSDS